MELTEDDGHSLAYRQGEFTRLKIDLHSSTRSLELDIAVDPYRVALAYPELEFILPAGEKRPLSLLGVQRRWLDEQSRLHLTWAIPEFKG